MKSRPRRWPGCCARTAGRAAAWRLDIPAAPIRPCCLPWRSKNRPDWLQVQALHVNHGLHPQAGSWEEHCRAFAGGLGVKLQVVHAKIDSGRGVEEKARRARLQAYAAVAADAILLAHHANDQIETFLLRALRGAGVRGLAGMSQVRRLPGSAKKLLRPLLPFPGRKIRAQARRLGLAWIDDPSNEGCDVNRNWLRNEVLPEAGRRFPGAGKALAASVVNARETAGLLDVLAQDDDQRARDESGRLRKSELARLEPPRLRNWLLWNFAKRGLAPPAQRHIFEVARQMAGPGGTSHVFRGLQLELVARGDVVHWLEARPDAG